ncbi:MAG: MFS transporter [Candidatus Hydrogenedens sp.]
MYVLYLRDILWLSERSILTLSSLGSLLIMLTAPAWGHYSDRFGSSPAILRALLCHALLVIPFIEFIPRYPWVYYLAPIFVVLTTIFSAAFWTSIHRAMLNMVPENQRISYTNLWTVTSGLALGITPIIAGQVIYHLSWLGFQICFITSGILCLLSSVLCYVSIKEQKDYSNPPLIEFLNPKTALIAVIEGFSISFGFSQNMTKTNREKNGENI